MKKNQLEELVKKSSDDKVANKNNFKIITSRNVFDYIENDEHSYEATYKNSIVRKLKKATNTKRKKDQNYSLKNTESNIVDVIDVSKYYLSGNKVTKVLKNVNLSIKRGEIIIIFGKSGSGKSILLNLISGLDRPSKGQVVVFDHNLPYLSDDQLTKFRRKYVSFIFQSYNLLQHLSGYDNVETGSYLQKDKSKKIDINELFREYEIENIKDKFPAQMSGGQQQRISILRALAKNADIIFADEPTGALDENTTKIVLESLYNINQKNNTTIVMVSHNPVIKPMADRIIYVNEGNISKIEVNQKRVHPKYIEI
ncbi:ABC transporter ATP-binding protein [Mycoplasmopsis ciconiae]|uniref:ABC transporter ATP-binding protein n=1 Tax=Mycoplasmopsis ciconiae TaxID=561067 RepID=A0ABU7ML46_9BACT|nr:ABC transporter ATP-binding protein [Mycoplasmopsis ciconiae]